MACHNLLKMLGFSQECHAFTRVDVTYPKHVLFKDINIVVKSENELLTVIGKKLTRDFGVSVIAINSSSAASMGLANESLVEVTTLSITNVKRHNSDHLRKAVVVVLEDVPEISQAYISQALLFSMTRSTSDRFSFSLNSLKAHCTIRIKKYLDYFGDLPYATKVIVCPVNSPCYESTIDYDYLLRLFFSKIRLIHKGDIIALNSEDDPSQLSFLHGERQVRAPIIYFEVKDIFPQNGLLVKSSETSVLQEKSIHSFIFHPCFHLTHYSSMEFIRNWGVEAMKLFKTILSHLELGNVKQQMLPLYFIVNSSKTGLYMLLEAMAQELFLHFYPICCETYSGISSIQVQNKLEHIFSMAQQFSPCLLFFENVEHFTRDAEGHQDIRASSAFSRHISNLKATNSKWPIIVIASSESVINVSFDILKNFLQVFHLQDSRCTFRSKMLDLFLGPKIYSSEDFIGKIAYQTGGMDFNQLLMLTTFSKQTALDQKSSFPVSIDDLERALKFIQHVSNGNGTVPKIPCIRWDDIGGLEHAKQEIKNTITLPLKNPYLLHSGLKRSGILLFGPPGTGKTLIAKAVATECSLNFLSVKGPELLNMYVGQSEENVREVFLKARSSSPCIVFFDELDSLAPGRGRTGDSGGVMDRVVSQLLAELDGISKSADIYVLGTTNRPDLIDPALLRPGRFDKLIYMGVDVSMESKLKILRAVTKRFNIGEVSLENIAKACPPNMTGADFYVMCFDVLLHATKRFIESTEPCDSYSSADVVVEENDFYEILRTFVPSFTFEELQSYNKLGEYFATCTI